MDLLNINAADADEVFKTALREELLAKHCMVLADDEPVLDMALRVLTAVFALHMRPEGLPEDVRQMHMALFRLTAEFYGRVFGPDTSIILSNAVKRVVDKARALRSIEPQVVEALKKMKGEPQP